MDSDGEWSPPSVEEQEIMRVKRERSDQVSKIMGQYMLKGYRMLDKYCPSCSSILLQTPVAKGGTHYCVSCVDVAAEEHAKLAKLEPKKTKKATLKKTAVLPATSTTSVVKETDSENTNGFRKIHKVQELIEDKMLSLAEDLTKTTSASVTKELLGLIKDCSETMLHVKQHST